ncbi:MAG: hypothetical protein ACLUD0_11695 [Eubacterium ramulus]
MWETLKRFGFSQGNLLEPSLGIGNFFSIMDAGPMIHRYGVEIDPVSARIAKQLYQEAEITQSGLENTGYENNFSTVLLEMSRLVITRWQMRAMITFT